MSEALDSVSATSTSGQTTVVCTPQAERVADNGWVCPEWEGGSGLFVFRELARGLVGEDRMRSLQPSQREKEAVRDLLDALEQIGPLVIGQLVAVEVAGKTVRYGQWEIDRESQNSGYAVRW